MSAAERSYFVWSAAEIRRVGYRVVDELARHLTELPDGPVFRPVPSEVAERLTSAPVPREGESADAILDRFCTEIAPYPFGNGHPRFYGWVNSPPAVIGVLLDSLAAAMNPSVAGGNHAAVWIEREVLEWFKRIVGFPADSMGLLVSGASAAAITGLAAARHRACTRAGRDARAHGVQPTNQQSHGRLVVYMGSEAHASHQKAIELLGIGSDNLRIVPSDRTLRMVPAALDKIITEDIARGDIPMAVIGSAGTVNTGAIDPLDALADLCARRGVWFHVDAAYGGPAVLTGAYATPLEAVGRADSIAIDPHKWLYVPVDAGLVMIRDAVAMRDTFSLVPPYLRTDGNVQGVQGPTWFSEYGPEQTRPFRALKVWAALRYFGIDGYRALIEHDLELARHLAQRVRDVSGFELWEPQGLSIVCFRAVPNAIRTDDDAVDKLNARVLQNLNLSGDGFLSSTTLAGRLYLRACIVNPRANHADVDAVFDAVQELVARCV